MPSTILLLLPVVVLLVLWVTRRPTTYTRDERNPYREHCDACGQVWGAVHWQGDDRHPQRWWFEAEGNVEDAGCSCWLDNRQ